MIAHPFREMLDFDEPGFGIKRCAAFDGVADGLPVDERAEGH